jgi:phosphodiesterase/alkaline phosphatase D-like protein
VPPSWVCTANSNGRSIREQDAHDSVGDLCRRWFTLRGPGPRSADRSTSTSGAKSRKRHNHTQPTLEGAHDDTAIIRWTTNNPGGANDHFGVVQYGTSPGALTKTAKSHIRLNQGHSETMFRVRIDGLQPQTTYYYTVTSMEANGTSDGVTSSINQFTTPAPGARIVNYPQPQG